MDEVGCIRPSTQESRSACAAWWVYMFATAAKMGIDAVGCSQLVGYPAIEGFSAEYPDVSMMDYDTPRPTAKYWVYITTHKLITTIYILLSYIYILLPYICYCHLYITAINILLS